MKFVSRLFLLAILIPATAGHSTSLSPKQISSLAPELASRLTTDDDAAEYHVLVKLDDRGLSPERIGNLAASSSTLRDRYQKVARELRGAAQSSGSFALSGKAEVVRRFWITNALEMRVDRASLLELAAHDDVLMVAPNVSIELLDPVSIQDATAASAGASGNLLKIGARSLWVRGLTGQGRLVASLDTGVEGTHPALADRWRGLHGDTAAAWFDPLNGESPSDSNGHGTHVMGIMVGRDGADTIGLAPDAEWICAAVIDRGRSLSTTFADILAALQWIVDPDGNPETMDDIPDVVCNSWGVSQEIINPCDKMFFEAIDHVEAMGVVCVFAAGNEGPTTMSIRNPADRAVTPTASFSVGAVDATTDALAVPSFSSRGPSACNGLAKKPEIAAPGVAIRSAFKGQSYKLINGTSMAAPHVAAAVALFRQYNPELTPEQIKAALIATAMDIGPIGEDNSSGSGMIDLAASLEALPSPTYPTVTTGQVTIQAGPDAVPALGETIELVAPITVGAADAHDVTIQLTAISPHATVTAGEAYAGSIQAGETFINGASPFVVQVASDARAGDTARLELRLLGDPMLSWWRDTVSVMIGMPTGVALVTPSDGPVALTLSNCGQLGLANGSVLYAGGTGWRTSQLNGNILYEGALMLSSADGGWSDASRRDAGPMQFDFAPQPTHGSIQCFADEVSPHPVGVRVDQVARSVYRNASYEFITVSWTIHNLRGYRIEDLRLGWLLDIDLPASGLAQEIVGLDGPSGGFYFSSPVGGGTAGLVPLSATFGALTFVTGQESKIALPAVTKKTAMQSFGALPEGAGDYLAICATHPIDLAAGDSVEVAVAFVSAANVGSFATAGAEARNQWLSISDADDGGGGSPIPTDYALEQNYPNPFNAGTTIPVRIAGDGSRDARLEIFDLLGRRVRILLNGVVEPGIHAVYWDGRTDNGLPVASGVYFARLQISGQARQVKSMVLIK